MTKKHMRILSNLHAADIFLRAAMVEAGNIVIGNAYPVMTQVTNDIRESEWHLDEAIAHVEAHAKLVAKKKSKKNLTSSRECVRMWA